MDGTRRDPPVITTSTPRASASTWATSSELVTTVSESKPTSSRASSRVVVPAPITTASPSSMRSDASRAIAAFSSAATLAFCW